MNNNLYHWHDERMVAFEMQEVNRAIKQARLLKDAGLSSQGWPARAADAFLKLLFSRQKATHDDPSIEQRSYLSRRDKLAH